MNDCLFCKIAQKKIPSTIVYEGESVLAFEDVNPQAPTHLLIISRRHIEMLANIKDEDAGLIGEMHLVARRLAAERGLNEGYRTLFNNGSKAGQSVWHLHLHLLGGRPFRWPPG